MGHPLDLLERARREGTPLIDGERATFVWEGERPPRLLGDFNRWSEDADVGGDGMPRWRAEADVWTLTLMLPRDGYFEYVLQAGHERLTDPLNPRRVHNGLGAANSWFRMPDAAPSPLILRERGTARGYTTRHLVRGDHLIAGGERVVYLYQPPVEAPCPLLVVWDGRDYLRRARIRQSVENLIAARRIEPVALALVEHGGAARFMEYACSESTLAFLMRHVLPLAQTHLRLVDPRAGRGAGRGDEGQAGAYGVLGASMGGLMALYTGLRLPDVFGRVLSQSGAFGLEIGGRDLVVAELIRQVRPAQSMRPAVWMDCGRYEWLVESNRRTHRLLNEHGYAATYHEYAAGHNYTAWRDDLARGIEALFPRQ
ncbi:MAG TPA: alpha/beta hydrolase-fold protein [Ktedonobacterales bacterium]|nr:alpha/beta hydrolase-fold protein [Ktedonobacterales bacterium]